MEKIPLFVNYFFSKNFELNTQKIKFNLKSFLEQNCYALCSYIIYSNQCWSKDFNDKILDPVIIRYILWMEICAFTHNYEIYLL